MQSNTVTHANKLAGWIEDFVSNFSKTESANEQEVKTAEINLDSLQKVVWNDETFYVNFDENGASIINGFGNTVTTLKNVHTLEEVDNKLNGKQIVNEKVKELEINAEMVNEIGKALAYLNDDEGVPEDTPEDAPQDVLSTTTNKKSLNDDISDGSTEDPIEEPTNEQLTASKNFIIESKAYEIAELVANEKIADATNMIDTIIAEKVEQIVSNNISQLYARIQNEIQNYDIPGIRENEVAKAEQEAQETVNKISQENSIDRTTPQGKYSLNNENDGQLNTNVIEQNNNDTNMIEEDDVELPDEEVETFKTATCPFCSGELVKSATSESVIDIKCKNCNVEYQVNTKNGKIYIK